MSPAGLCLAGLCLGGLCLKVSRGLGHLFSPINLFNLALTASQSINNQPFAFGQSYTAAQFSQFGFVFSVVDNIHFDPELGYVSSTPYSGNIIANSTHITGANPFPRTNYAAPARHRTSRSRDQDAEEGQKSQDRHPADF